MKRVDTQKGGVFPLRRLPPFKYTINEERKQFVGHLYPYSDYFLKCVNDVRLDDFRFEGECEYLETQDDDDKGFQITKAIENANLNETQPELVGVKRFVSTKPTYKYYFGGVVYELLNRVYAGINLHRYCDATGDIDCIIKPPQVKTVDGPDDFVVFIPFAINGNMTRYYREFTETLFNKLSESLMRTPQLNKIPGLVEFDINEYTNIQEQYKTEQLGYRFMQIGKVYAVSFFELDMYKTQIVCKVEYTTRDENNNEVIGFAIDHIAEFVLSLPTGPDSEANVSSDTWKAPHTVQLIINSEQYQVRDYSVEISRNIESYIERIELYNDPNTQHKAINHIARIFYLYEVFYQFKDIIDLKQIYNILIIYGFPKKKLVKIRELLYYKIVQGEFQKIKVDIFAFMYSYIKIIKPAPYYRTLLISLNQSGMGEYFKDIPPTLYEICHDVFIDKLFNDDMFLETNGTLIIDPLTISAIAGRKRKANKKRSLKKKGKNTRRKRNSKTKKYHK